MKLVYKSRESQVCPGNESESRTDYLKQIEVLDSSGLTKSLMKILESTKAVLYNNKGVIDIVTRECILTDFLKRITTLVSGEMKTWDFDLKMEDKI